MTKQPRIRTNIIYSALYQFVTISIPFIVSPYVTRVLSTDGLGVFSKSEAIARYFVLFSMLGVNNYGNRAIARCRNDYNSLCKTFWEIYSFQLFFSLILTSIYFVCFHLWGNEYRVVYLLQILYVSSAIFDTNWFCIGMENFKLVSLRNIAVKIITASLIFVFVKNEGDLLKYTLIMSGGYMLSAIISWPYVFKTIRFVRPSFKKVLSHIKPNALLFVPVLATSVYNLMDRIMLGTFSLNQEVAFYTYAESIVTLPTSLILALDSVIMPRMSNLFAKGDETSKDIVRLMDSVMLVAMFLSTGMAFGIAAISRDFVPWFYGNNYVRCGLFVLALSPVILFKGWAGALRTQYIIPSGNDRIYIVSIISGAIINIVFNLIFIPKLFGIGAIIGTIAAEFTVCAIQFFSCRKKIKIKKYLIDGGGLIATGAVMFVILELLPAFSVSTILSIIIKICIGVIIYLALSMVYLAIIRKDTFVLRYIRKN